MFSAVGIVESVKNYRHWRLRVSPIGVSQEFFKQMWISLRRASHKKRLLLTYPSE